MQALSNDSLGLFSASAIFKLFVGGKGATRDTYIFEKAEEIVKGHRKSFRNKDTDHGHMNEYEGIQNFKEESGLLVEYLDQRFFPINKNAGATPDAKVVDFSGITIASLDIKCPTETFFRQKMMQVKEARAQYQNVPKESYYQGQMQMMALSAENEKLGHPPVTEHYLVRYLTKMEIDDDGNKHEYDLPLNVRLFYKKITSDKFIQDEILKLVDEAAMERDVLVNIFKTPIM